MICWLHAFEINSCCFQFEKVGNKLRAHLYEFSFNLHTLFFCKLLRYVDAWPVKRATRGARVATIINEENSSQTNDICMLFIVCDCSTLLCAFFVIWEFSLIRSRLEILKFDSGSSSNNVILMRMHTSVLFNDYSSRQVRRSAIHIALIVTTSSCILTQGRR